MLAPYYQQICEKNICENLKFNFLTYFSNEGRHVTHQVIVPHQAQYNGDVRIVNLYGWKVCSDVLPHTF